MIPGFKTGHIFGGEEEAEPFGSAIVFVPANTSSGVQTITGNLDGLTPKAAMFYHVHASAEDAAHANPARWGMGVTEGTNQWAYGVYKWGQAYGNRGRSDCCVLIVSDADVTGKASFVSFVPNGVEINWSVAPSLAHQLMVVLFAGDGLSAKAGVVATPAITGETVDVGFLPELVFIGSNNALFSGANANFAPVTYGVSAFNGSTYDQRNVTCWRFWLNNSRTISYEGQAAAQTTALGAVSYSVSVDNFAGTSFEITPTVEEDDFGYLALSWGGNADIKVGTWSVPTTLGDVATTSIGFEPTMVLFGMFDRTVNTAGTALDDAVSGVAGTTGIDTGCSYMTTGAGSNPSQTIAATSSLRQITSGAFLTLSATFVSFDADGWTFNYTTVPAGARDWWYVAIRA